MLKFCEVICVYQAVRRQNNRLKGDFFNRFFSKMSTASVLKLRNILLKCILFNSTTVLGPVWLRLINK
jgi:hypothetical protein